MQHTCNVQLACSTHACACTCTRIRVRVCCMLHVSCTKHACILLACSMATHMSKHMPMHMATHLSEHVCMLLVYGCSMQHDAGCMQHVAPYRISSFGRFCVGLLSAILYTGLAARALYRDTCYEACVHTCVYAQHMRADVCRDKAINMCIDTRSAMCCVGLCVLIRVQKHARTHAHAHAHTHTRTHAHARRHTSASMLATVAAPSSSSPGAPTRARRHASCVLCVPHARAHACTCARAQDKPCRAVRS